jgi:hypothetical protein
MVLKPEDQAMIDEAKRIREVMKEISRHEPTANLTSQQVQQILNQPPQAGEEPVFRM